MEEKEVPKKTPAGNPYLKVIVIDDETQNLSTSLGISEERNLEIALITKDAWNSSKLITEAMIKVSVQAKHANELAMMCFHLGNASAQQKAPKSEESLEKLKELLKKLKGNLGQGE